MTTTQIAQTSSTRPGSVAVGHLVFTRGASHLTIGADASMEDLYRARFEGKMPDVAEDGGTVTVRYRPSLRPTRGEITLSGRVPWDITARWSRSDLSADLHGLCSEPSGRSKRSVRVMLSGIGCLLFLFSAEPILTLG